MADYKKKNVKKLKASKPRKKTIAENYKVTAFGDSPIPEDIPVKSSREVKEERRNLKKKEKYLSKEQPKKRIVYSNKTPSELNRSASAFKVIKGTKRNKLIRKTIAVCLSAALILGVVISQLTLPTGLVEAIGNAFAKSGKGSGFPITISGGTVYDMNRFGGCISVLSDTHLEIYNTESKEIISEQHGFSSPGVSVSDSRILLFDRGSTSIAVYNLSGKVFDRDMKENISTASIGRNGTYCVATYPEDCASKIYLYNKDNAKLLSLEFDFGLINSVAVSDSGKSVAVSIINAEGGEYKSNVVIYESKSGEKIAELKKDELVYSVSPIGKGYAVATANGTFSVDEGSGDENELHTGSIQNIANRCDIGFAAVSGIKDSADNVRAVIYGGKLDKIFEGKLDAMPNNMDFNSKYIAVSKDNYIYVYSYDGSVNKKINTGFTSVKFALIGDKIYVINNSVLTALNISDETGDAK